MIDIRNFTKHLLITFALSISLQAQVTNESRAAEQEKITEVNEATETVIQDDEQEVRVSDQEGDTKKYPPLKKRKRKKRRRKRRKKKIEKRANPETPVEEANTDTPIEQLNHEASTVKEANNVDAPVEESIEEGIGNRDGEESSTPTSSLKRVFPINKKIKIIALLSVGITVFVVYKNSGALDVAPENDEEKKDEKPTKEEYFKEEELQKVTDDSIPKMKTVEGSARINEEGELQGINLTFDIDKPDDKEDLIRLYYYVKVDEQSNIQVELSSDVILVLDNDGNVRKEEKLTLSPNGKKIIQDETKGLTLDLKVWIGAQKKVTQEVKVSIQLPSILDCFECVYCNDTFKDKIEDKEEDFKYALSHCCKGKTLPDGTQKPVYRYYCQDCANDCDKCAIDTSHNLQYKTREINLAALAKYVPADDK